MKKTGKTYVIGSQGCMDSKWHKAAEWIKAGKLGPVVWGQGSYCRNNKINSEWTFPIDPDVSEKNLDWNRWLGKVPKIPFNPEFPRRVVATGTRKVSTDREITDTTHLLADPSGLTLLVVGTTVNEQGLPDVIRGRNGTLHFASSQNRVELKPEAIFTDEMEAEKFADPQPPERIERLDEWETPRLCRGGSRSLTTPGVT